MLMSEKNTLKIVRIEDTREWDQFIKTSPQGTIFMQSVFWNALGFDTDYWGVNYKGILIATIAVSHIKGIPVCNSDMLNQYNGVCFSPDIFEKSCHAQSKIMVGTLDVLFQALCEHYPRLSFFLHPSLYDIRGIQWVHYHEREKGIFDIAPIYTGCIDLASLNTIEEIIAGATKNRRRDYKKALKSNFTVENSTDIDMLAILYEDTFSRQGISVANHMLKQLKSLSRAAIEYGFGNVLVCKTDKGQVISASLIVEDDGCAYYLVGTNNPDFRNTGAGTYLMISAIEQAREKGLHSFDFIGINSPERGDFKLSFGAKPVMTFAVNWVRPA